MKKISLSRRLISLMIVSIIIISGLILKNNIDINKKIQIPIIMYHNFIKDHDIENIDTASMKESDFIEQIKYLKQNGYTTITFEDLLKCKKGIKRLPKKPVLIKSDDGYLSNYEFMYKVLKEYNMKGTIFLIGKRLDEDSPNAKYPKINWDQAREMYKSGIIDFQSHTYNIHNKTDGLRSDFAQPLIGESQKEYENRIDRDIKMSINQIKKELGYTPIALAYPYGEYSETSEKIIKENGIKISITTDSGIETIEGSTYLLKRITASGYDSISTFIEKLNG